MHCAVEGADNKYIQRAIVELIVPTAAEFSNRASQLAVVRLVKHFAATFPSGEDIHVLVPASRLTTHMFHWCFVGVVFIPLLTEQLSVLSKTVTRGLHAEGLTQHHALLTWTIVLLQQYLATPVDSITPILQHLV